MNMSAYSVVFSQIIDIESQAPITEFAKLASVVVHPDRVVAVVRLDIPCQSRHQQLQQQISSAFQPHSTSPIVIQLILHVQTHAHSHSQLQHVKNIVLVSSAKGGVGKSTTAVNLALGLCQEGACVGLLDADIYGPSIPTMLGVTGKPESNDGKTLQPFKAHAIEVMSIGLFIEGDTAMIWRGPMVTNTLLQLLQQTQWGALDYLVVDLPPGTGDIQLTMAQKAPVTGAVVITTPQDIALQDAIRGIKMFTKVNIPVLGLIENMSMHVCSHCGHVEHIFGADGTRRIATQLDTPLLGQIPLDATIGNHVEIGQPTVVAAPGSPIACEYLRLARCIATHLAALPVTSDDNIIAVAT